jgi:hypothetical protein
VPRRGSTPVVGKSGGRTPAKHAGAGKQLGREVGVASRMGFAPYLLDLCAGDGSVAEGEDWARNCSPGLVALHAGYRPARGWPWPPTAVLTEKQDSTYRKLLAALERELPQLSYPKRGSPWRQEAEDRWVCSDTGAILRTVLGDSAETDISEISRGHSVYVLQDPNAIGHWPMRRGFIREIRSKTRWCLSMSTLGCNPNGHKAWNDRTAREGWFRNVEDIRGALVPDHDLYLARIVRDSAQWAYLFEAPSCWRSHIEEDVDIAFTRQGLETEGGWCRLDPAGFEHRLRTLFLTKNELKEESA